LAKKHGTDAVDGLRSTVMDYAFTQASKQGGFSPTIFQRAMFEPIAAGQPSLYTMMRRQGIMDKSHGKNMQALLVPMMRVERELAGGQTIDDVIKNLGLMGQFATRFVGAQAGSAISRMAGGAGTIQIPAYGASVAQELFDKIPNLSMRKILEDATKDPAFMAQILSKKGIGNTAILTQSKQMHAYLVSQGYTDAEFNEENLPVVPETATTGAPASKLLRQLPRAPQTTGLPFLSSAQAAQPGPAAPGPGPAAPALQGQPQGSSRQMLQSLFPFDTTLQVSQ
jgi:GTP cyclohydrolase II